MKNTLITNIAFFAALTIVIWNASVITAQENSAETISVFASKRGNPFINFADGKLLTSETGNLQTKGATIPLALASADFDRDGTEDLAIAYKKENGGLISIQRGNVESIFPKNNELPSAPFFSEANFLDLPFAPDFLIAGDFNADGKQDLLAAKIGAGSLFFNPGTGNGNFAAPQTIELGGKITALTSGEMNNFDNLADVAVGITEKNKSKILIFQNRAGAFAAEPEGLKTGKPVNSIAFGELNGHPSGDLIAASGDELLYVSGSIDGVIKEENISRLKTGRPIANLTIGDFAGERENEIAVLSQNGEVFIYESAKTPQFSPNLSAQNNKKVFILPGSLQTRNGFRGARLLATKISTRQKADLIVTDNENLHLVTNDGENFAHAATLDSLENIVAILPMRLNKDALADLVVAAENSAAPSILMTEAIEVITVNNATGSGGGGGTTLFNAIQTANNTPGLQEIQFNLSGNTLIQMQVALPVITDAIVLNGLSQTNPNGGPLVSITVNPLEPTDGPTLEIAGGNSVVRGFIINGAGIGNPLRLRSAGNNFVESNFIGTSADGMNAGGTTASGIDISNSSANTIGGSTTLARNIISGVSGGFNTDSHGIQTRGAANDNLIKGNYIGVSKDGLRALANGGHGVYLFNNTDGAPLRTIIGGSTDGARNVISGNAGSGLKILPPAGSFASVVIENNFVGTNKNGDAAIGNDGSGVLLEFAVGSSAPTAVAQVFDNVISGNTGDGVYAVNNGTPPELNAAPEAINSLLWVGSRSGSGNISASPEVVTPGNRIGTNAAGTAALPNTGNGVNLQNAPAKIEGNIISGNGANGIKSNLQPDADTFSQIADNYIGVDASGANDLGNSADGINLEFNGTAPTSIEASKIWNNVISGNNGDGLEVSAQNVNWSSFDSITPEITASFLIDVAARRTNSNAATTESEPTGNYIGTNAAGTAVVPNNGNGIKILNAPALIENNLISGNALSGIRAKAPAHSTLFNQIADNYIGTDAAGNLDLGNIVDGITFEVSANGIRPATSRIWSNVISGNNGDGIRAFASTNFSDNDIPEAGTAVSMDLYARRANSASASPDNLPTGNRIGTNASGNAALGNSRNGISINSGVANMFSKMALIGGTNPAEGNIIAYNGANGVVINSSTGNFIGANQIFSNALLNVDLGGDGLTPNDLGDADTGANNLQNYPILTSASSNGTNTIVSGTINTTPNTDLNVQFYATLSNSAGSLNLPLTNGGSPFGMLSVRTNSSGNALFSATFPVAIPAGRFISATATTTDTNAGNENNTSEVSPGIAVLAPTSASVLVAGRVLSADGSGIAQATVSLIGANGAARTTMTNPFGYYRFNNVEAGATYIFNVRAKSHIFTPQVITINEETTNLNFTPQP